MNSYEELLKENDLLMDKLIFQKSVCRELAKEIKELEEEIKTLKAIGGVVYEF